MNSSERWLPIKSYEGSYEVSDMGRIRSLPRYVIRGGSPMKVSGRIVRDWKSRSGYLNVSLNADGVRVNLQVHRLVMEAFAGEAGEMHVNHIDGDKINNVLPNLEYVTPKANTAHAMATGLMPCEGESNPSARYTADQIRQAHALVLGGATYAEASSATGVNAGTIVGMCHGKLWKSLGLSEIRRMPVRALKPAGA